MGGASVPEPKPEQHTISVQIGNQTFDIPYVVTGGSVRNASANVEARSLMFLITSSANGTLTIWLPTEVIIADNEFSLSLDGKTANLTELNRTANARVLQIGFEEGAKEIEVLGTSIVPEFGVLPIFVTSIAIIGIAVATRRFTKWDELQG